MHLDAIKTVKKHCQHVLKENGNDNNGLLNFFFSKDEKQCNSV